MHSAEGMGYAGGMRHTNDIPPVTGHGTPFRGAPTGGLGVGAPCLLLSPSSSCGLSLRKAPLRPGCLPAGGGGEGPGLHQGEGGWGGVCRLGEGEGRGDGRVCK